ncbi:uncharacterized protein [Typha angustifolia]|uniref:uncharacterized protein n=1 Tax=Typha angustifolia TaxID=59011 RepID=UPI003C30CE96
MAYDRRQSSVFDTFSLSPVPYPVLLILLMVLLLLSLSWFFTFEDFMETAEEQMNWALLVIPVLLVIVIGWTSSIESFDGLFGFYQNDRQRRPNYEGRQEGSSPWGVVAVIVLLLILVSFQPTFQDMWKP